MASANPSTRKSRMPTPPAAALPKRRRLISAEESPESDDVPASKRPRRSSQIRNSGAEKNEEEEEEEEYDDDETEEEMQVNQHHYHPKGISPAQAAITIREGRLGELARALVRQAHFQEGLLPAELLLQAVTGEEKLDDVAKEWPSIKASLSEAVWLVEADDGKTMVRRNQAKLFLQSVAKHSQQRKGLRHQVHMALQREWDGIVLEILEAAAKETQQQTTTTAPTAALRTGSPASTSTATTTVSSTTSERTSSPGSSAASAQPSPSTAGRPSRLKELPWLAASSVLQTNKVEEYVRPILLARNQGASHWEHAQHLLAVSCFILSLEAETAPLQTDIIVTTCLMLGLFDPEHVGREVVATHDPVNHHVDQLRISLGLRELDTPLHQLLRILRHATERTTPPPSMELPELAYVNDALTLLHSRATNCLLPLFAGGTTRSRQPLACCPAAGVPPSSTSSATTLHTRAARSAHGVLTSTTMFAGLLRTRTTP